MVQRNATLIVGAEFICDSCCIHKCLHRYCCVCCVFCCCFGGGIFYSRQKNWSSIKRTFDEVKVSFFVGKLYTVSAKQVKSSHHFKSPSVSVHRVCSIIIFHKSIGLLSIWQLFINKWLTIRVQVHRRLPFCLRIFFRFLVFPTFGLSSPLASSSR